MSDISMILAQPALANVTMLQAMICCRTPYIAVQWLAFLLRSWKFKYSNIGLKASFSVRDFSWFSQSLRLIPGYYLKHLDRFFSHPSQLTIILLFYATEKASLS